MRSILVWQYELTIYEQNEVSHCQAAQAYIALGRGEGKKSKELSGGNKIKTCLACATIGDS